MIKVKALRSFTGPGGAPVKPGAVVELDNGLAQNLILRGRAERVKAKAEPPADSKKPPADQKPPADPKK